VFPISEDAIDYLEKATQIILIENNYSGQFGQLLEKSTGININAKILKYSGLPFYVDELAKEIKETISGKGGKK